MGRHALPFAFALLTAACGARNDLPVGTETSTGPHQEHIYVSESDTWGTEARILRFDDLQGTNWTTYRPVVSYPCNIVVDDLDRIYFATSSPPAVMRMNDMSGEGLESFVDSGPDEGQIGAPSAIAIDDLGRLYVTDAGAHRVVRMNDLSGNGWTAIGGPFPGSGAGQFNLPQGIALAADGRILVADSENGRVVQMDDISGAGWKELPLPATNGQVPRPIGVSYDAEGRIYIAEFWTSTLYRFDSIAGDGRKTFNSASTVQLSHVFAHPSGRIYLGMLNGVSAVGAMDDMEGTNLTILGTHGAGEKQFRNPCGVYVR